MYHTLQAANFVPLAYQNPPTTANFFCVYDTICLFYDTLRLMPFVAARVTHHRNGPHRVTHSPHLCDTPKMANPVSHTQNGQPCVTHFSFPFHFSFDTNFLAEQKKTLSLSVALPPKPLLSKLPQTYSNNQGGGLPERERVKPSTNKYIITPLPALSKGFSLLP